LRKKALLAAGCLLLGAFVVSPTLAQDDEQAPQIRSGARVENPPSGQNIRVWVRRAYAEPRGYTNLNSRYSGRVSAHPVESYLRAGERRMEHCIDSAEHPEIERAPDLNGNHVIRARISVAGHEIQSIEMSEHPLSPVIERCMRAGFAQTRYHFPSSGRVIAVFYLRPR
jgi:hypothetical protein